MERKTITKLFINPVDKKVLESAKEILSKIVEVEKDNNELQVAARQGVVNISYVFDNVDCSDTDKITNIDDEYYATGYDNGNSDGYDTGYDDGHSDGYDEGYDDGYNSGKSDGYSDGYDVGHNEGHDEGYDEGYEDARNDFEKDDE